MSRFLLSAVCLCLSVGCSSDSNVGTVPIELSDPNANVTVTVDGKPIQITSLRQPFDFSVGDHELRVEGDRYETIERTWQVVPGVNPVFKIDLVPETELAGAKDDTNTMLDEIPEHEAQSPTAEIMAADDDPKRVVEIVVPEASENNEAPKEDPAELTAREKELVRWVENAGGSELDWAGLGFVFPKEARVTGDDFERFHDLPHLDTLYFQRHFNFPAEGPNLSDSHLLKLKGLPNLKCIIASGITDRSMEHLSRFPLTRLEIHWSAVSNEGLEHFSRHQLSILQLQMCPRIGDEGLLGIDLSRISNLSLEGTGISDRLMASLSSIPGLQNLDIGRTKVTGQGLAVLQDCRNLIHLRAWGISIQDEHLRFIRNRSDFSHLEIGGTKVTADGIRFITTNFPKLKTLGIGDLMISESQIIDWSRMQDLQDLGFERSHIGNRQLQSFTVMKNLRTLRISTEPEYFSATRQGLLAFNQALPECRINGKSVDELIRELSR